MYLVRNVDHQDQVDLRLAESYIPLSLCIVKCVFVVVLSITLPCPMAHVLCGTVLVIDKVSKIHLERTVNSNSVAWGVLCAFLLLFNGKRDDDVLVEEAAETITSTGRMIPTVFFLAWGTLASYITTEFYLPLIQNNNPSVALLSSLWHFPHTRLPRYYYHYYLNPPPLSLFLATSIFNGYLYL